MPILSERSPVDTLRLLYGTILLHLKYLYRRILYRTGGTAIHLTLTNKHL